MDDIQFKTLIDKAKDSWEKAEKYRFAYSESSDKDTQTASVLKWLTLGAGFMTGLSSLNTIFTDSTSSIIISIAGVFTGVLVLSDKIFQWEANSNTYWSKSKSLENLQSELYQFVLSVRGGGEESDPSFVMQIFNDKINAEATLKIKNEGKYTSLAKEALKAHNINNVAFLAQKPQKIKENDALAEDAKGIQVPSSDVFATVGEGEAK